MQGFKENLETKHMVKISAIVGTSVVFQQNVLELISEYDSKGITEISINTLKQLMIDSFSENIAQGLFATMIKNGEFDE